MDIHYSLFHDLDGFDAGKIRKVNISKVNFEDLEANVDIILEVRDSELFNLKDNLRLHNPTPI